MCVWFFFSLGSALRKGKKAKNMVLALQASKRGRINYGFCLKKTSEIVGVWERNRDRKKMLFDEQHRFVKMHCSGTETVAAALIKTNRMNKEIDC